jgi:hypothetical protein
LLLRDLQQVTLPSPLRDGNAQKLLHGIILRKDDGARLIMTGKHFVFVESYIT